MVYTHVYMFIEQGPCTIIKLNIMHSNWHLCFHSLMTVPCCLCYHCNKKLLDLKYSAASPEHQFIDPHLKTNVLLWCCIQWKTFFSKYIIIEYILERNIYYSWCSLLCWLHLFIAQLDQFKESLLRFFSIDMLYKKVISLLWNIFGGKY